ncbi:STAS domain-containing protein [Micromonospora yasonensis]|uniref:STAS domain-containing protein n=1 Tax=Micromonospora yasonensis TaxID=1128667 RepID=UPI00222F2CC9|nr:STAS domain-containing protein [Micromonospora yasonensis]MCW3838574.1 STAS domain-containing protein [Micromonospora yasonensis]
MQAPLWQHAVDRGGDFSTVTLFGELDLSADRDVKTLLASELGRPGLTRLLVDMSAVTFIDSTVLGTLVYAHNVAHEAGRQFTVSPSERVRRIVEITGLSYLFNTPDR